MKAPVKVGLFSTAAIVIFVFGFYFLKGINLFESKNRYYAVYDRVDGLYKSNLVEINGFKVGTVGDMDRDPVTGKIVVRLDLETNLRIPKSDSTIASLFSTDFLGTKKIKLVLGNSNVFMEEGDTINTYFKKDITEQLGSQIDPIMAAINDVAPQLDTTITRINWLLDERNPQSIQASKRQIDALLLALNKVVNNNEANLQLTIASLKSIMANIEKNNETIDAVLKNARGITDSVQQANLKQTIENLNGTIQQLNGVVTDLNAGKGSLGKIMKEEALYNHVDSAVGNLNSLVKDIKNRPYRYINVSVFGAKKHEKRMEEKYNESGK